MRCLSGHSWVVQVIRVCKMGLLLVSNWNCFKRASLISKLDCTKCTWWIKLSLIASGSEPLKYEMLRVFGTSMSLPGEYWSSKSYFWRRRKNFWIRGGQEIIDPLKIDFNGLWSLITINLHPYKYSWKPSTPKKREGFLFYLCVMFAVIP